MSGTASTAAPSTVSPSLFFDIDGDSQIDFKTLKAASDTIKKNQKLEFNQTELLKLLSYLEGELQARDVVIAALKSENMKQFINTSRYKPLGTNDPNAALFRDSLARKGNFISRQSSAAAAQSELSIRLYARQQLESLENTVLQQRLSHLKLIKVIEEAEAKHTHLMNELEEEKQKHERDTAQGDDITYGLEVERTRLKQDLEVEKQAYKKLEKELKKLQEQLESERNRQKPIVLLLLAERKRIIMKYIEERKRSEDLAQILSEEKQRVDTIAEGLEEESKKSLRMEAELEKQMHLFELERKQYKTTLAIEEKRLKEQDLEIAQLKAENEMYRKQTQHVPLNVIVPQLPIKFGMNSRAISDPLDDNTASPMMSSVAKVVQPTATVTSVPVSGPTTGIARSISPGQSLRQQSSSDVTTFNTKVTPRKLSNAVVAPSAINNILSKNIPTAIIPGVSMIATAAAATSGTTSSSVIIPTATIKKNLSSTPSVGRGVPPPIPPNKPIIPPKREPSATRLIANNSSTSSMSNIATNITSATNTVTGSNTTNNTNPIIPNSIKDSKELQMPSTGHAISAQNQNITGSLTIAGISTTHIPLDDPCISVNSGNDIQDYQQVISSIANK